MIPFDSGHAGGEGTMPSTLDLRLLLYFTKSPVLKVAASLNVRCGLRQ